MGRKSTKLGHKCALADKSSAIGSLMRVSARRMLWPWRKRKATPAVQAGKWRKLALKAISTQLQDALDASR